MGDIHALLAIGLAAVLAPLLARLPPLSTVPAVVVELLFGIILGPSIMGLVTNEGAVEFLAQFGLIFLFFQAGFEFNPASIGAPALRLGAQAWLFAFGLGLLYCTVLYIIGLFDAPLLAALVMPTTAFGILLLILRDYGNLGTEFGRYVLGLAAAGEIGPILLTAIVLAQKHRHLYETFLTFCFFFIAIGAIMMARSLRSPRLTALIAAWMHDRSILPVRVALLILLGLVSLANEFGMEMVLGAYAAGTVIAMLVRDTRAEFLENRLLSIGTGFFIPVFFVASGAELDLSAVFTSVGNIARLIFFCAGLLFIRLVPLRLYRPILPESDLLPLALFSATTLSLVIAITHHGVRAGDIPADHASAFVGAAVIAVTFFPTLAIVLRAKGQGMLPEGALAALIHRAADSTAAQYARLRLRITEKLTRKIG
ncbi:MAG TPA: cation:proton antiporter [Methylocella sp.]|nr:cation:proton antiporter [Methylocella sp.]